MTDLVAAIVRAAHRRRSVVVLLCAVAVALSAIGIRRLSFDANVLSLLPEDGRTISAFKTLVDRFGNLDQLYVVFSAPEGHAVAEYSDEIDGWIDALRDAPEIERVDSGALDRTRDFSWLANRQLLLLPPAALRDAIHRFTIEGARTAVAGSRDLLSVPSADVSAMVRQDPLQLFALLRTTLGGAQSGLSIGGTLDGIVTADGRQRLVMAQPKRPPYDTEFAHALLARLEEIKAQRAVAFGDARDIDDPDLPPLQVEFAGGHRIAVETEALVRRESIANSVGSLVLIVPLLVLVFRSAWLMLVGPLPSALSLVLVLGALGLAGVQLSAAATGAAAMLFGLGVDGVVLLYVAHQSRQEEGADGITGPSVSMLLGMFTTAATFYGLTFVDFPSLQQLGQLIGHSMVVCGLLTLVLVPALLPRRKTPAHRVVRLPGLARWIGAHRRAILATAAAATIVLACASLWLDVDPTLDRLRSTTDAARQEERLAAAFGLPTEVTAVIASGPDLEPLLETNERLAAALNEALPDVAVQPASRFLPSRAAQQRSMDALAAGGITVDSARLAIDKARVDAGFTPGAFTPFLDRLPAMLDVNQRLSYDDFISNAAEDIIGRFVARNGAGWLVATYINAQPEQLPQIQSLVDRSGTGQILTGLTSVNAELERRFLPDFIKGLSIGTLIVVVLVLLAFRDWRLSALALLPTVIGLIWAAGLLALFHVKLDLFATFAVVTFVGIGVDYGIHLVHRFHERGDAAHAIAELAPVILVAAAITLLGYATLIWSSYAPLRSIGVVSAVSIVALAMASVVVLPAMLSRPPRS